ncbi:RNA polymerase I termination factor [Aristolochia californica]|uniref:RNA polymerase I termination factor n=1 Tax=Aristolochia californica TaxID=171875 RepID=UPI0035D8F060
MEETAHLEKKKKHSKKEKKYFAGGGASHGGVIGTYNDSQNMDFSSDFGYNEVKEVPQREKRKKRRKFDMVNGLGDDDGIFKTIEDKELEISISKKVVNHKQKENVKNKDVCLFSRTDITKLSDIGEQTSKKHWIVIDNKEISEEGNTEKKENQEDGNDAKIRKKNEKMKKKKDIFNDCGLSSKIKSLKSVTFMDSVEKSMNDRKGINNNHMKVPDTLVTTIGPLTKEFSNEIKKSIPSEEHDAERRKEKKKKKKKKKKDKKDILDSDELVGEVGSLKPVMSVNKTGKSKNEHKKMDALPESTGPLTKELSKRSKKAVPTEEIGSHKVLRGSNGKKKEKGEEVFGIELKKDLKEMIMKAEKSKTLDSCEKASIGEDISQDYYEGESNTGKRKRDEDDHSLDIKPSKKHKRVSFLSKVDVFPYDKNSLVEEYNGDLVRGKRFSQEEDEILKQAVFDFIKENNLGDNGLHMVLHCRKYGLRACWHDIGAALPWRPVQSVNHRAHIIFERAQERHWEPYEYEMIRRHHEIHGGDWRSLAAQLGKSRKHIKDTWRRINLPNKKKGHWRQFEYQALFDLVNVDKHISKIEEQDSQYGMLRDNISWEAISQTIGTRTGADCCRKWYNQLTSPMVMEGIWDIEDDKRLLEELLKLDASSPEDIDWENLLVNRPGEVSWKRWSQMTKHIGEFQERPFGEQVEVLALRYYPSLLTSPDDSE